MRHEGVTVPTILNRSVIEVSPWVRLVAKTISGSGGRPAAEFHNLDIADYVSVLAVTDVGLIPVVQQYRPAVERETLEFPGGLLDAGEEPSACAARELVEECGLNARSLRLLGKTLPDSGRLGNRMWCYFAEGVEPVRDWSPELGIAPILVTRAELCELVCSGAFDHAPHLALYALARAKGAI